ncbi:hypothetical protein B0H13DRAFT_2077805, partial [Mycena leptocephala]
MATLFFLLATLTTSSAVELASQIFAAPPSTPSFSDHACDQATANLHHLDALRKNSRYHQALHLNTTFHGHGNRAETRREPPSRNCGKRQIEDVPHEALAERGCYHEPGYEQAIIL